MRLHASCVAYEDKGVLIKGAAGTGKSSLALALMAFGARLVADDQTIVDRVDGWPTARPAANIAGMIEARGIGLLAADSVAPVRIALVIDMDQIEDQRLPESRYFDILGEAIPLLHFSDTRYFHFGVLQYLRGGRMDS